MNASYRWLQAIAPGMDLDPEALAHRLALRGAPVEGVIDLARGLEDVVIARVESARQHPNADRLTLCDVEGPDGRVQVVCGAPNVREGAYYPFAPVGASLPGGAKIKKAKIRGETSVGMLCSERELGLGTDHAGILELRGEFEIGRPLVEALALEDYRFDVEVTPNRGDLLSHQGIARELHPAGQAALRLPDIPGDIHVEMNLVTDPARVLTDGVEISIEDPDLCYRYLGAVIRGVEVGPSPEWLATRLRAAGARPINNVVDATNYVLLELGQPLHAFDLDTLGGCAVVVRRARGGERLQTLDGEDRPLGSDMLAICDAERPVAVAGVMGGQETEVSDSTHDVLLECALFEPKSVRATRRALGMSTDASYRFERGVDPDGMEVALRRALEIILATAGGSLHRDVLDVCPRPWSGVSVELRPTRVERVLGVPFEPDRLVELLAPLGYTLEEEGEDRLQFAVPGYRSYDTIREVDLIEEVARTHGYDRFPADLGPYRPGTVPDHLLFQVEDDLRRSLTGRGFFEAHLPGLGPEGAGCVPVQNPMSSQESHLRRSLIPGLLRVVERNLARGVRDVRVFEMGTAFRRGEGPRPVEAARIALVCTGARAPTHWSEEAASLDLWDLKDLLASVAKLGRIDTPTLEVGSAEGHPEFDPERALRVVDGGGRVVGIGGPLLAEAVDTPPWAGQVVGLEVELPSEPTERPVPVFAPLPQFPGTDRDIALLVPDSLPVSEVFEAVQGAEVRNLARVHVFDQFRGEGIPDGSRSVAFRLRFVSEERTLTDEDVDRAMARMLSKLKEALGVEPRG